MAISAHFSLANENQSRTSALSFFSLAMVMGCGGDDDEAIWTRLAFAAESLNGLLGGLESGAQVGLPDVAARDETERDDVLGVGKGGEDVLELLGARSRSTWRPATGES